MISAVCTRWPNSWNTTSWISAVFSHIAVRWKKLSALPSKNALQSCAMLTLTVDLVVERRHRRIDVRAHELLGDVDVEERR